MRGEHGRAAAESGAGLARAAQSHRTAEKPAGRGALPGARSKWFDSTQCDPMQHPIFTLHVRVTDNVLLTVRAYEGEWFKPNHTRLYCEGLVNGRRLFPRESFYVGIPGHDAIDGDAAKHLVLSLFAMKPGDTDDEFFGHYTAEQLAFVTAHGEELSMVANDRYGEQ